MILIIIIILAILQLISGQIDSQIDLIQNIATDFDQKSFFISLGYNETEIYELVSGLNKFGYQVSFNNNLNYSSTIQPLENAVFIINFNSKETENILNDANNNNLFSFPIKWIIINNNNSISLPEIIPQFSEYNILVDSDIIVANIAEEAKYSMVKIYKRNIKDTDVIIEEYGSFTNQSGLIITETLKIAAVRRKNLMKTMLKTAIVITHNDTLNHLTDYRDKHIDSITKVNYILVNHLANIVNATLWFTIKNSWGYKNNSKWTGMIGELTENRAEIGGTPLFVTSDRVAIIDYIAMTTPTKSNFVFRQPKLSYVTNVFTLPFDTSVWLSSAALVAITTIGLFVMLKWEKFTKRNDPSWDLEPKDATMMSFGAVCQQGASHVPDLVSGRIVTLFIFVSFMFLYTSYSANIVALLQSSSNSIQTLGDLLKSRLQIGVDDTVFNRFYFPAATEPIRRALYLQKVAPKNQAPRFLPIEEGVKRMRQGLFAFHMEGGSGYKLVGRSQVTPRSLIGLPIAEFLLGETFYEFEKCDLKEISFLQVPDPFMAIQKNSSYKEMLKIGLRTIQESGLQSREVSKIYTKKPVCHGSTSSFISVGLIDIYAALELFAIGLIASLIIFVVEMFIYRRYNKKLP